MNEASIVSIITAILTLTGVIVANLYTLRAKRVEIGGKTSEVSVTDKIDERTKLWGRIERLEDVVHKIGLENDTLVIKNADLTAQLSHAQAQIAMLQRDVSQYRDIGKERDQLRDELHAARLEVARLSQEVDRLRAEIAVLRQSTSE
jgi:predicted RNase H-like nuclease (RuvC/YqgF family)